MTLAVYLIGAVIAFFVTAYARKDEPMSDYIDWDYRTIPDREAETGLCLGVAIFWPAVLAIGAVLAVLAVFGAFFYAASWVIMRMRGEK